MSGKGSVYSLARKSVIIWSPVLLLLQFITFREGIEFFIQFFGFNLRLDEQDLNLISILIIFVQKFFQLFKLNADTYYIAYVPVEINLIQILLLNLITIFICYVFLIIPVKIISKIKPYSSLRMN